jgi:hypothetical protein
MPSHPIRSDAGYAPPLVIVLTLHGEDYNVASTGPDRLSLRDARNAEPGRGVVRFDIDGNLIRYDVDLFEGIDPSRADQKFRLIQMSEEPATASAIG